MDLAAIWLAIKTNLAPMSVFSVGGILASLYRRFNKRFRFRNLRDDAREAMAGFSRYQHHRHLVLRPGSTNMVAHPPETLDVLVEMLYQLQAKLDPLGVYLFRSTEISTGWITCADRPMDSGARFAQLGQERVTGGWVGLADGESSDEHGHLREATKLFPKDYRGERVTIRASIVGNRDQQLKSALVAHGHDPEA